MLGTGEGGKGVEHRVHERERLGLLCEVACGEERDRGAEGSEADLWKRE